MIIGLLCLGFFVLANMPNSDPKKLDILVWHMSGGMLVFVLMILRPIIRRWSARPATAVTGSPLLDRLASMAHIGFYVIVFLMIATGWTTGWLISGVFQPDGGSLPETFRRVSLVPGPCGACNAAGRLIAVHVAAALYHQFVLKDGLFRRMWFGKRTIVSSR